MFNTLVYIPTILAYTFITLLLVILGFIVIYVAHKIYTTVYDNLPVAQLSSNSSISQQIETLTRTKDQLNWGLQDEGRKSKTALRIIVTLEPCYLAYMVFETKLPYTPNQQQPQTLGSNQYSHSYSNISSISSIRDDSQTTVITGISSDHYLLKYFVNLASIPTGRDLKICDNLKFYNMYVSRRRRRK